MNWKQEQLCLKPGAGKWITEYLFQYHMKTSEEGDKSVYRDQVEQCSQSTYPHLMLILMMNLLQIINVTANILIANSLLWIVLYGLLNLNSLWQKERVKSYLTT